MSADLTPKPLAKDIARGLRPHLITNGARASGAQCMQARPARSTPLHQAYIHGVSWWSHPRSAEALAVHSAAFAAGDLRGRVSGIGSGCAWRFTFKGNRS